MSQMGQMFGQDSAGVDVFGFRFEICYGQVAKGLAGFWEVLRIWVGVQVELFFGPFQPEAYMGFGPFFRI